MDSVKNPISGRIVADSIGEIIHEADSIGEIIHEADKVDISRTEIIEVNKNV